MFGNQKRHFIVIITLTIAMAIMLPTNVSAAIKEPTMPYASDYLASYNSYVCAMGDGRLEIWFSVAGNDYMDDVGTLTISLYESEDQSTWTRVKTYTNGTNPEMLGHGVIQYNNYVSYQGVAGRYYKAYVTIWAGIGDNGDARYMWTTVEHAT